MQRAYVTFTVIHIKTFVKSAASVFVLMALISGILIYFLCYSWFGMWVSLKTNLGSCIVLILNIINICHTEVSLTYFPIQTLASTFLFTALSSRGSSLECQFRNCVWFSLVFPGLY